MISMSTTTMFLLVLQCRSYFGFNTFRRTFSIISLPCFCLIVS